MIEYFRLNIEYLRNSFHFKKDGATRGAHAAQARALRERLRLRPGSLRAGSASRATSTNIQFAIFNFQFPDKPGFPLRSNRLVRVRSSLTIILKFVRQPEKLASRVFVQFGHKPPHFPFSYPARGHSPAIRRRPHHRYIF